MTDQVRRVVYIEDEVEMIDLVKLILSRRQFDVLGAGGGREGLDLVRKALPEVYQQLKADETTKSIPVIVVTAKAQNIDKVLGLHIAKVDDYIAKPFSPNELLESLEKVLEGRKTSI